MFPAYVIHRLTFPAILLLLAGCSLFELRDADEPDDNSLLCLPVYTPSDVIQNFQQSVSLLNPPCYFECFVDSTYQQEFRFVPETEFQDEPLFENWTTQNEYDFLNALQQYYTGAAASTSHQLTLTDALLEEVGDSALYHADYQLELTQGDSLRIYAGAIQLKLTREGTFQDWAIYYWEDQAQAGADSWTELKAWLLQ